MKLETFLARRYLSSHRGSGLSVITWIAIAGVTVGAMSLVTVLAVMSGFERELRTKILGNNAHILVQTMPASPELQAEELESNLKKIRGIRGVASAMPVIYGEGFILSPFGHLEGVLLKGVDPDLVRKVLDLDQYVSAKNWKEFREGGAILGETLARGLNLSIGDGFTLVLNRGEFSPLGVVPRMKKLKVADTFKSGMTQYDAHHGYVTLAVAENIFEVKPRTIEVRTKDTREIPRIREEIKAAVPEATNVQDWISLNQDFLSALQLGKAVMAVILGLIVLVASFNICGSLIMIVRDKTKDIAILKSMGCLDQRILKIFFIQGLFIGGVGTAVGLILGIVLSILLRDYIRFPLNQEVYMITTLPVDLRLTDTIAVALGALAISSLATIYPARLASRVIPTEGLKAD